ncbi:MAG: ABC transporter permease [Ruminococcus sp.]|nr:ABC transporter permease [Ruminococcus sp.]MBR2304200.1 ABC transporter permease [Ruminococcus sp.]
MKDIITVTKKELRSCLSDKMICAQIILLPFLMVFGYVLLMSSMMSDLTNEETKYKAYMVSAPSSLVKPLEKLGCKELDPEKIESIKDGIGKKQYDMLIVFPEDFAPSAQAGDKLQDVEIWYNTEKNSSMMAYQHANDLLSGLQPKAFTVNVDEKVKHDLGDSNRSQRMMLGMILPLMLLMSAFQVCSNLAAESIAGDKERGFLNTMLITPVKRRNIAAGKSIGIFAIAFMAGLSGFIGMALSIPRLEKAMQISGVSYTITEYLMLFLSTFTAVAVLASILLVISTLSKTVKQATTIAPIITVTLMVCSFLSTMDSFAAAIENLGMANNFIPAWNAIQNLKDIICLDYSSMNVLISCGFNVVISMIAVFVVGKCFESEKIVNG